MNASSLVSLCGDFGLRLEPCEEGRRLLVVDLAHVEPYIPHALFLTLVEKRDEILAYLRARHLLKQCALGEFKNCDAKMARTVAADLENHLPPCPARDAALARLEREGRP
jgi:hypothetical protein